MPNPHSKVLYLIYKSGFPLFLPARNAPNAQLTRLVYADRMIEAVSDPMLKDSAESALRHALSRADDRFAGASPVLAYVLSDAPNALFSPSVIARLRAMLADLARQLIQAAQGDPLAPVEDGLPEHLAASLADCLPLLRHLHAMAMEWHMTERLVERLGLDPVLSPLVQALVASDEPEMAATAMHLLAAQARFGQQSRRMQIALTELPGDVLHAALQIMRAHLAVLAQEGGGDAALADSIAAEAEARIRGTYDESTTRLGLCARVISGLGGGAMAALEPSHAGFSLFVSALAITIGQPRDVWVLATQEGQAARLMLGLRAAGLKDAGVAAVLAALQAGGDLPRDFARITPERAGAILARGASFGLGRG